MRQTIRQGITYRTDPQAEQDAALSSLTRALIGEAHGARHGVIPADYVRKTWREDRVAPYLMRAPVTPTDIASASALQRVSIALLSALTGFSAGAQLLGRSLQVAFDGASSISVPSLTMAGGSFVQEGKPIPFLAGTTGPGITIQPHKLCAMWGLTAEMMAAANAEQIVRQTMLEATSQALDAALFSTTAGDTTRPAGILNGVAALTAATGSAGFDNIVADMKTLVGAIAAKAGSGFVIVTNPAEATTLAMVTRGDVVDVLVSSAIPAGTVIAIVPAALAAAAEENPRVEVSREAEIHRETVPQEIVSAGGAVAVPVASIYQTDSLAVKLVWPLTWGIRTTGAVSWIQGANW
jgi:hypothetical protein